MNDLIERFENPGAAYRGKPFWSWNGELNEAELIRQIHVLRDMGMGGFFMHSRTGLATEYLGEAWFDLTNACADEAAKMGLEAWLYDEDRWPSGTAGGLVTADPAHRAGFISLTFPDAAAWRWDAGLLAAFACRRDGLTITNVRRLAPGDTAAAGETVLDFRIEAMDESTFFNGATYVDTMSRPATDAYLDVTHERYKSRCGDRLGRGIRGIFTDEPHRGPVMCGFGLSNANRLWMTPWTPTLFEEFETAFGYELTDRLPELFLQLNGAAVSPVKWQYMELTQRLFLKNFMRPLYDWCTDNHMQLTGHVLHEDSLTAQACMQGTMMRSYEPMHVPGIDVLTEGNRCYWVAKQLDSVARQLGRPWRLSELYGCTGWQMDFAAHKAVGDWQALFGVNVRCHHLSWVTMAGEAKRDYPASISFQSAWWPQYKFVEDYFSRLGVLMSHGRPVCDVLVIHPVESVWCQIHGGWAKGLSPTGEAVKELDEKFAELFHWLAGAQVDFDYGDEEMLGRLGGVEGRMLRFGEAKYRTVVVGKMTTLRGSTLRLLERFASAGGRVVFAGDAAPYVDATADRQASELAARVTQTPWDRGALLDAVRAGGVALHVRSADGAEAPNVFAQVRVDDDGVETVVLLNVDRDQPTPPLTARRDGASGRVIEWDLQTGDRYAVTAGETGGGLEWPVDLPAGGTRAFTVGPRVADGLSPRPSVAEKRRHDLTGPFEYELIEPNVCVLDFATFAIEDGDERSRAEVLKIDRAVRQHFGLKKRAGDMVQPWFRRRTEPTPPTLGRVRLSFAFDVADAPATPVKLALEQPGRWTVTLNDRPVDTAGETGWWVDPAIRTVRLPADALRAGRNTLAMTIDFDEGVDIEAVYLLGAFGVAVSGSRATITTLPDRLSATDVAAQGLPFYGGPIRYKLPVGPRTAGRLALDLPGVEAACSVVGNRVLAFPPLSADITDADVDGVVPLDVVLTRRNTFGPLHQVPLRTGAYGPENWTSTGERWSDDYQLYPAGLQRPPVLVEVTASVSPGS